MNRFRALERPSLLNRGRSESASMSVCLCDCLYMRLLDLLNVQVTLLLFLLIDAWSCVMWSGIRACQRQAEEVKTGWLPPFQPRCTPNFCVVAFAGGWGLSLLFSLFSVTEQCVVWCVLTGDAFEHWPRLTSYTNLGHTNVSEEAFMGADILLSSHVMWTMHVVHTIQCYSVSIASC